jgi:uncharacterized protein YcfJ
MKHKTTLSLIAAAIALSGTQISSADSDGSYFVNAKVIDVEPIVRYVDVERPREVCWKEQVHYRTHEPRHRSQRSPVPTLVGGLIGGVVGNQVGRRGHHRDALTVAGTILGAAIGHGGWNEPHEARSGHRYTTTERHCETRIEYETVERIDGYDVTYLYHGQRLHTRTDYAPGERIRVKVDVTPLEDDRSERYSSTPDRQPIDRARRYGYFDS